MQVIEYLKKHGIEALTAEFAIIVKKVDDLLVLNYNQIESPKTHPIVIECRSLILDTDFNIVSRSFDRFFNYGEALNVQKPVDFSKARAFEKVDGSLIKIYCHKGVWRIATRGTAYAESNAGDGPTFKTLVLKALDYDDDAAFQDGCNAFLDPDWTYIHELTSFENRVVKRYEGYTLHYLAARHNQTGEYGDWYEEKAAEYNGARLINFFTFDTVENCVRTARELKNLDEGYVIYQDGEPMMKIKSPAYLAVHAIRGEGLTPKRIAQLVLCNEQEEYLAYFPEDAVHFDKYINAFTMMLADIECKFMLHFHITDQKEFAMAVKDYPFSAAVFRARNNNISVITAFHDQTDAYKLRVLEKYID